MREGRREDRKVRETGERERDMARGREREK